MIDDTGQVIQLQQPAKRIVSLAPDLTELLFAVGAGENIVGVMRGSDYPLAAKKIPIVANYNSIDSEAILALHPDLIVSWTDVGFIPQLKMLNIPVYLSHQKKIVDIPATLSRFGKLTGYTAIAEKAAAVFSQDYHSLQKKYSHAKMINVFYQVWSRPLITITQESWINEIIILCGGKNSFEHMMGAAPEVSLESVVVANPDVIIGMDIKGWNSWSKLTAVKKHHVYELDSDVIERAGPRLLVGMEAVCSIMDKVRHDK